GSSNNNWNTAANWSLNAVPTAAHDVVININAAILVDATTTINSLKISASSNVSFTASSSSRTISIDNNGSSIDLASTLTINGTSIGGTRSLSLAFTGSNRTMNIAGSLILTATGGGGTYKATNSITTVTGTIKNNGAGGGTAGTINSTTSNLSFLNGGTYEHALNGGTVPTATWNANSTLTMTGITTSMASGLSQNFGNLVYNSNGQTGSEYFEQSMNIAGNFTILSTGTGSLRVTDNGSDKTVSVAGNFTQSAGEFKLNNDDGAVTMNVAGDFILNGANAVFILVSGQAASSVTVAGNVTLSAGELILSEEDDYTGTLNVAGNFSHTGGTITETADGTASGAIKFNGTASQLYTSGGTVSNKINFTVNNGATLQMATPSTIVTGAGSFSLLSGATLGVTAAAGISITGATGNIQVSGTRSFAAGSSLIYNGNADQVIGAGFLASRTNLTIDNPGKTITAGGNATISGTLTITAGSKLNLSTYTLADGGSLTNTGAGTLQISNTTATPIPANKIWSSIVEYNGATQTVVAGTYANLKLAAGTKTAAGNIVASDLYLAPSSTLSILSNTVAVNGILTGTGSFTGSSSSNIEIGGTALNQTLIFTQTNAATRSLNNLTIKTGASAKLGSALELYGTLTLSAATLNLDSKNLALKSSAVSTASIGDLTGSILLNDNNVSAERFISAGRKWRLLSTATNGQTFKQAWQEGAPTANANPNPGYGFVIGYPGSSTYAGLGFDLNAGAPTVKTYNAATNGWVGISSTNNVMTNQTAYMSFVIGDRSGTAGTTTVARSTGNVNKGTQPVITIAANKFEAIGNPYPSAVDLTKINTTGLQEVFYVWDPKAGGGYGLGAYQTLVKMGNDYMVMPGGGSYGAPLSIINTLESGQGFFVKADVAGGTLQFEENDKVSGSRMVSRTPSASGPMIRSILYSVATDTTTLLDGAMFNFDNNFSNGIDADDVLKMTNGSENVSVNSNGTLLLAERRKEVAIIDTLKLNLTGVRVQQYKWSIMMDHMVADGREAFLRDAYTNTLTPLSLHGITDYAFSIVNIAASYASNRFSIVFGQAAIVLPVSITSVSAVRSATKTSQVTVNWKVENEISMGNMKLSTVLMAETSFLLLQKQQQPVIVLEQLMLKCIHKLVWQIISIVSKPSALADRYNTVLL
ncbi:MAG: beta strand repeat-containing protein, partial [Ferruginibacter sp.]